MTPGDEYVDPLIARGEELMAMERASKPMTQAEAEELDSLQQYALAKLKHTSQFPLANTAQEESAQYLAAQEARSALEREVAVSKFLADAWEVLRPILLALAKDAIAAGVKRLDLPTFLAPVATVVSGSVDEAVRTTLDDVAG